MKKRILAHTTLLLVLLIWLLPISSKAQSADQYIFTPAHGIYSYISGGTIVAGSPTASLPIGFTFNFCGTNYTTVKASDMGWLLFSGLQPNLYPLWLSYSGASSSEMDGSLGSKSYQTTGAAPDRVFTFEWRNWRWLAGDSANISFQVRLYETSNKIEFLYKEEKGGFNYGTAYASIGIGNNNNLNFLSLNSALPVPIASSATFTTAVGCRPATGQIYSFVPPVPCSGMPDAGAIAAANPWRICSGNTITLIDTGYSKVSGLLFQWQSSLNSTNWSDIPGATDYYYTATVSANTYYRLKVTCVASGLDAQSAPLLVDVSGSSVYNTLPYIQDFENWQSYCGLLDVPGAGWVSSNPLSVGSWKRDDQYYFNIPPPSNGPSFYSYSYSSPYYYPGFVPNYSGGNHSAFYSNYYSLPPSNLDLYVDCSAQLGNKALYFDYINKNVFNTIGQLTAGLDSFIVLLSDNGGASFTRLAAYSTDSVGWERKFLPISSNSPNTIIRFHGSATGSIPHAMGLDSVCVLPPCSGLPVAGVISPAGPVSACPGAGFSLTAMGYTMGGDITYSWEYSVNNGSSWTPLPNFNSFTLHIPALYDTTLFRLKALCNGSGQTAISNIVTFNIQPPQGGYASLPFVEDFESWMDRCDTVDVPGSNGISSWTNYPAIHFNDTIPNPQNPSMPYVGHRGIGWRRNDFLYQNDGYFPYCVHGDHSARFYGYQVSNGIANLDLLVDCSSPGNKELRFFINADGTYAAAIDSFKISYSTDGGISFNRLFGIRATNGWELKSVAVPSNAAKTIIRFSGIRPDGSGGSGSYGLDFVKLLTPCSGQPSAGSVDSVARICPGIDFHLNLIGATQSSGLTYQWQRSSNGNIWNNISGATSDIYAYSINTNTWFRCIVTCAASGLADTTPAKLLKLSPFYFCYCNAGSVIPPSESPMNIGYAQLKDSSTNSILMTTGDSTLFVYNYDYNMEFYSDYMDLPITIYRDSSYLLKIGQVNFPYYSDTLPNTTYAFIDFNRDGVYDVLTEKVFEKIFSSPHPIDSGFFVVPSNAGVGFTGMRLIMKGLTTPLTIDPCDYNDFAGEVEDYVVKIDYAPCNGSANPGVVHSSDTLVFSGDIVQLTANGHDDPDSVQLSQLAWIWQSSPDGVNWTDISGSEMQDTLNQSVTAKTWYRLKMICQHSLDSTFSDPLYVNVISTGISSVSGAETIHLYPNPTTGKINLQYSGVPVSFIGLTITDLTGRALWHKLYQGRASTIELDLAGYPKGVYLIRTDIGTNQFNNRIILK